jgi:N-ethylmaleimide reductase
MPREIAIEEIPTLLAEYANAARNAIAAGMDGVELHCASGYLINQFLNPASNRREDNYGGPVENRIRFPIEVLKTLGDAVGANRVGFRISPGNSYNGMDPSDPAGTFGPFVKAASSLSLAYLHVIDMGLRDLDTLAMLRANWSGKIVVNNNLKVESAKALLSRGRADAVSFGRAFIANPDLVERFRAGVELAKPDFAHVYVGEEKGYTDYPRWNSPASNAAQGNG